MAQDKFHYANKSGLWAGPVGRAELDRVASEGLLHDSRIVRWEELPTPGIRYDQLEAPYQVFQDGKFQTFYSERDLFESLDGETIRPESSVYSYELGLNGIRVDSLMHSDVDFEPSVDEFLSSRSNAESTVICGPNNAGKTLLLKHLQFKMGRSAHLLLPGRIHQMSQLSHQNFSDQERRQAYSSFVQSFFRTDRNFDQNSLQLERVIGSLDDAAQDEVIELLKELLGCEVSIVKTEPNRRMSPWTIMLDRESISMSSTGTRLLILILALCKLPHFQTVLIDEPELGLSPKVQAVLSKALLDSSTRAKYFPHLRSVIIATHSHMFLDRSTLRNNFAVTKDGQQVSIRQIQSASEFHELQFDLIGNDLGSLFLPEVIVIVEGKLDSHYLEVIARNRFPDNRITFVWAHGDGGMLDRVHVLKQSFGDLSSSPYQSRVFCILDSQFSASIARLERLGILSDNIIVWERNGIEYLYPKAILEGLFGEGDAAEHMKIENDRIEMNGKEMTKADVSREVVARFSTSAELPNEIEDKFVSRISRLLKGHCDNTIAAEQPSESEPVNP